jgi:hypothetical protein
VMFKWAIRTLAHLQGRQARARLRSDTSDHRDVGPDRHVHQSDCQRNNYCNQNSTRISASNEHEDIQYNAINEHEDIQYNAINLRRLTSLLSLPRANAAGLMPQGDVRLQL